MGRDYKKEYQEYHSKPEQKKNRAKRNKANRNSNCGPGQEVDHKVPLIRGGSNSPSNWRVVSEETNRKKGSKKMSSFDKLRLAIAEKTAAPEGVERLPSGGIKYRGETFPGYNKPKAAPKGSKHKKRVLAKKGDKVKIVNFGARGYKHNYSAKAKKSYLARSAGIKGKDDKFSANYWSRKELWPKNQKADGSAKKAAAEFDAYKYWASLTPEQRQAMGDSVNSSMLGVTKEMNKEMEPLGKELQEYMSPYQDRLKAITDKYNPRLQEALLKGYEEAGASAEYLDYIKNEQPNFTHKGKIASADALRVAILSGSTGNDPEELSRSRALAAPNQYKTAAAEFDVETYYKTLDEAKRNEIETALSSSINPLQAAMEKEYQPYYDKMTAISAKYQPQMQKAYAAAFQDKGLSQDFLDYMDKELTPPHTAAKSASATDNFDTSAVEAFISSARK